MSKRNEERREASYPELFFGCTRHLELFTLFDDFFIGIDKVPDHEPSLLRFNDTRCHTIPATHLFSRQL